MSAQETTLFEFPCIGDDLNEKDRSGDPKFTLDLLRRIVDECSNPPAFRGVKTPITELLDQDTTKPPQKPSKDNPRDRGPKDKDNKGKLNSRATEKKGAPEGDKKGPSKLPAHERPSTFPQGLKRPDLNATVDGNKIASEFQRQLFDDITGNCLRCHAKTHSRATCKEPAGRWETKFDAEKDKYWLGTLKWQQKSQAEKAGGKAKPPPTLIQKESRFQTLSFSSQEDDNPALQHRSHEIRTSRNRTDPEPPGSDDEDDELTPAALLECIMYDTDMHMVDYIGDAREVLIAPAGQPYIPRPIPRRYAWHLPDRGRASCTLEGNRTTYPHTPPTLDARC
jgi:hypothetical protein